MKKAILFINQFIFIIISMFYINSCSHNKNDDIMSMEWENESFVRDIRETGIFINDNGNICIKCKNKPFIAILDILAYKLRFNYTLSTDMHSFTLSIFKKGNSNNWQDASQLIFKDANVFFMYAIDKINTNYIPNMSKISFRWTGDGPDFFKIVNVKGKYRHVQQDEIIKKFFFKSLAVQEDKANTVDMLGSSSEEAENPLNPLQVTMENSMSTIPKTAKEKIDSLLSSEEKSRVKILEITTQNALILRGDRTIINHISNIIYSMDVEYPQVLVETKVFEYDDSLTKKIGTLMKYSKTYGSAKKSTTDYEINNPFFEDIPYDKKNLLTSLPSFFFKLSDPEKKMSLLTNMAMSASNGLVKILAEPRLLLKPGSRASIKLKTVKYVDSTGQEQAPDVETQSIDCGILFEITPIILAEDKIMLKIKLQQSEFLSNTEDKIVQSKMENIIDTTVVALDGQLINIGGIILNKTEASSSGIPFLKDIPYLGRLFGSKKNFRNKVRIEFMIKPTVKFLSQKLQKIKIDLHKQDKLFEKLLKKEFSF